MLNIVWPIFIILSFTYVILFGNVEELNTVIFSSITDAVDMSIMFLGTMCFWNGIMQIANKTTILKRLTKLIMPLLKILFPKIKKDSMLYEEISMNMVANILGMGNAATPIGLKAMTTMQKQNEDKNTLSDEMAIFIVLNTASIQIIPTTVIALRSSLGSTNPTSIVFPVWVATICAAIAGITVTKICIKLSKIKKEKMKI